jgi:hypothetical protein
VSIISQLSLLARDEQETYNSAKISVQSPSTYLSTQNESELMSLEGNLFSSVYHSYTNYIMPIQNGNFSSIICELLYKTVEIGNGFKEMVQGPELEIICKDDRKFFPLKSHPSCLTKTNIFLRDVIDSLLLANPSLESEVSLILKVLYYRRLYNDAATCWLLWFYSTIGINHKTFKYNDYVGEEDILETIKNTKKTKKYEKYNSYDRKNEKNTKKYKIAWWVLFHCNNDILIGELGDIVKACGTGADPFLCSLTELKSLKGRDVGIPDLVEEKERRTKKEKIAKTLAKIKADDLKIALREIIREELQCSEIEWPDSNKHWSKRWAYTKSGAHPKVTEDLLYGKRITGKGRVTRREFAEAADENVIAVGRPMTVAGMSLKLELGKTRVIFGADTRSYYTFDHYLTQIERRWLGRRVLLRPATEQQTLFYGKLGNRKEANSLMFDFTDFNSQHSTEAMQMCLEVIQERFPYKYFDWIHTSLENEYIKDKDGSVTKKIGTLFSGHRGTTFFNSLLNAAYCRVLSGEAYKKCFWYHVGDDVLCKTDDLEAIDEICHAFCDGRVLINKSKQSIGRINAEFLRVSFNNNRGNGYLARSIGSLVCGNWVNDFFLDKESYINTLLQGAWSLCCRAGKKNTGLLLLRSFQRRVPELAPQAYSLLRFRESFKGSPVLVRDVQSIAVVDTAYDYRKPQRDMKNKSKFATQAYLDNHVSESLMSQGLFTRGELCDLMLEASYKGSDNHNPPIAAVSATLVSLQRGQCIGINDKIKKRDGVLSKIFPLAFLKDKLSRSVVSQLLDSLGYEVERDVLAQAWGYSHFPCAVDHIAPFSDLRSISSSFCCAISLDFSYPLCL